MALPADKQQPAQRGFTLVEMLVVLILAGLICAILFQGLDQAFRLQSRAGDEMDKTRRQAMLSDWFRQAIEGAQPDYEDGKHKFQATGRRISALTTSPLDAAPGGLAAFTLALEFDNRRGETLLRYGEGEDAPVLMAWAGDHGRFVFLDADHAEHDAWPPPLAKKPAQLPLAVRLEGRRDGQPWALFAHLPGPDQPRPRVRDLFGNPAR